MPVETLSPVKETQYTHKSFELVFHKFCNQYAERVVSATGRQSLEPDSERYLGLSKNATLREMKDRLEVASAAIGEPPDWDASAEGLYPSKEAILLSSRHLAWFATMGSLTQGYVDRLNDRIKECKHRSSRNGGSNHNIDRLYNDRREQVSLLIAQNDAISEYFESELAHILGNDSPAKMDALLSTVPFLDERHREGLVSGLSLEIATGRYLGELIKTKQDKDISLAHGSSEQDSRGGDFVFVSEDEIIHLDINQKCPKYLLEGSIHLLKTMNAAING